MVKDLVSKVNSMSKEDQITVIKENSVLIQFIEDPCEEVQMEAVKDNVWNFRFLKNPSVEVCKYVYYKNADVLIKVDYVPEEFQIWLSKRPEVGLCHYIKNATCRVIDMILRKKHPVNVWDISRFNTLSESQMLRAVKKNPFVIRDFKNPSQKVLDAVDWDRIKEDHEWAMGSRSRAYRVDTENLNNSSEKVKLEAVSKDGDFIQYIENPSLKVISTALNNRFSCIEYIKGEIPYDIIKEALKINGRGLEFLENPSLELQKIAIESVPCSIKFIKNPCEEIQILAVKKEDFAINYISNPCEEAQLLALESDKDLYNRILNPCLKATYCYMGCA